MELDASGICDLRSGGLIGAHVTTVNRVAEQLGEDEDWLGRRQRDGNRGRRHLGLWRRRRRVLAFTDFGIESLIELIKMYKDNPTLLKRYDPQ
jgi:hypothetical protein